MEAFVLFLLKLVVYPSIVVGLAVLAARLYKFLRETPCLKVTTACKARVITGVVAGIALCSMSRGWPERVDSVSNTLTFACYIACVWVGGSQLWARREEVTGWLKSRFDIS